MPTIHNRKNQTKENFDSIIPGNFSSHRFPAIILKSPSGISVIMTIPLFEKPQILPRKSVF